MSAQPDIDYSQTPGLHKKCSRCGEWQPYSTKYFYAKKERSKEGKLRLDSWCKKCRAETNNYQVAKTRESEQAKEKRKAKLRALQRARIRLANLHPEQFQRLVDEEFRIEGWEPEDDLRGWANRRRGSVTRRRVHCRSEKCGWTGMRKLDGGNLTKPCPQCGRRVKT